MGTQAVRLQSDQVFQHFMRDIGAQSRVINNNHAMLITALSPADINLLQAPTVLVLIAFIGNLVSVGRDRDVTWVSTPVSTSLLSVSVLCCLVTCPLAVINNCANKLLHSCYDLLSSTRCHHLSPLTSLARDRGRNS